MKSIIVRNIALMVVFSAIALTMFTENVRTVQIVGLLACGAVFGAALTAVISAFKSKQTKI
jgi:lipopolysaccharide export LptBFGC system permease protein LptF